MITLIHKKATVVLNTRHFVDETYDFRLKIQHTMNGQRRSQRKRPTMITYKYIFDIRSTQTYKDLCTFLRLAIGQSIKLINEAVTIDCVIIEHQPIVETNSGWTATLTFEVKR